MTAVATVVLDLDFDTQEHGSNTRVLKTNESYATYTINQQAIS